MKEFQRYLKILGMNPEDTSFSTLSAICFTHLTKIPFENISKLYRLRCTGSTIIPELSEYLDGIEQKNFGGTCYSNNYYLNGLLDYLGFDATLCAADMKRPHAHMVNLVRLDGKEFIVDVGYAAPFLSPLPRDLEHPFEIRLGRDSYFLHPKAPDDSSRLELIRDGKVHHGYRMVPRPRKLEDFKTVIENSFRSEAVFMNSVLLVRFENSGSTAIHNYTLIRTRGQEVLKFELHSLEELIAAIQDHFSINPDISRAALHGMPLNKDVWS